MLTELGVAGTIVAGASVGRQRAKAPNQPVNGSPGSRTCGRSTQAADNADDTAAETGDDTTDDTADDTANGEVCMPPVDL